MNENGQDRESNHELKPDEPVNPQQARGGEVDSTNELFSQATRDFVPGSVAGEPTSPSEQLFSLDSRLVPPSRPSSQESGSVTTGLQAGTIPKEMGRFHHIEVVKSGGFGIVCRARDSQAGRVVALKFPRREKLRDQSDVQMFVDEANRAMDLDHPGIVKTYSVEATAGLLAIVQEFIEGSDLRSLQPDFTNHQVIATLVAKIAEALSYAHRRGIYHRDLKPANILIDRNGNPYITDFGLAMHEREQLFLPKQRCGTPHYMPPELVAGLTRRLDGRSDIWSLGVILYELLTKRKPFLGVSEQDIYEQIENNDPRPPRQIDPTIDRELQRICMKCLERQQRDRYPTADDLAEDLRHWVANPGSSGRSTGSKFVPRGLRTFTAEDADFFLELLPGSRDRNGLPTSLRFWLNRIVPPTSPDLLTPIGILFGPSGSGKSSFIKAGLLPLLGPEVLVVHVDCTLLDTEQKLLRILLESLDAPPAEIPLAELCAGISQGLWRPRNKSKVLIVLDQLEQRLCRGDDYLTSTLSKALRHCDGRVLQALVICRDDFLMSLSRFSDSLGMDLREGENAQAIDLFNRKHARQVLLRFGQAFGQLPDAPSELSPHQETFLQSALTQLAAADYIVCVQLVLFAEMFRDRPWTPEELEAVGGVAGTGEKFLEYTFGPNGRDKRLRDQHPTAEKILEALLPPAGTDIRGGSKSLRELQEAVATSRGSDLLQGTLKSLDERLKLISPVELENVVVADSDQLNVRYQLSHDSLIPSIRSWLERQQGRTPAGRARLQLRELGGQVLPGKAPRYLPSHWEWLTWQWRLPANESLTVGERAVWTAAKRRFLRHLGVWAGVSALVGIGLWAGWRELQQQRQAWAMDAAVEQLLRHDIATLPEVLAKIDARPDLSLPRLRRPFLESPPASPTRIRAAIGLGGDQAANTNATMFSLFGPATVESDGPIDPAAVTAEMLGALTDPELPPAAMRVIIDRLQPKAAANQPAEALLLGDALVQITGDVSCDPRSRFRALIAQRILAGSSAEWLANRPFVIDTYAQASSDLWDDWLALLQPAAAELEPVMVERLADAADADFDALAWGLMKLGADQPIVWEHFANQLIVARPTQFAAVLAAVERGGQTREFSEVIAQRLARATDDWGRVICGVALARLGRWESLAQRFSYDSLAPETILAVSAAAPGRLRVYDLQQMYDSQPEPIGAPTSFRRSLLLALAQHASSVADDATKNWLSRVSAQHITQDPDACCFSAAELIRRRMGYLDTVELRQKRRANADDRGILGDVLIDQTGLAFSLVEVPAGETTVRVGVCTHELTYGEMQDFLAEMDESDPIYGPGLTKDRAVVAKTVRPDYPFLCDNRIRDLRLVYRYCNWLSQQNGIVADRWAYPTDLTEGAAGTALVQSQRPSFRLLTTPEWIQAAKSANFLSGLLANQTPVIQDYAWSIENSAVVVQPVATRLPDSAGLFDLFGNVSEVCHAPTVTIARFVDFGNTVRAQHTALRNHDTGRASLQVPAVAISNLHTGFRIAIVLP